VTFGFRERVRAAASAVLPSPIKRSLKRLVRGYHRRFRAFTPVDLNRALVELGVVAGDVVMVHSAFDSFVGFQGGPVDAIRTLQEVVGERGTLMMPTIPFQGTAVEYALGDPVFDVTLRQALATQLENSPFLRVMSDQQMRADLGAPAWDLVEHVMNQSDAAVRELVSTQELEASVAHLCALGEKVSGSEEERKACEFLTARLKAYGYAPTVHTFESYISYPRSAKLSILAGGKTIVIPAVGVAFAVSRGERRLRLLVHLAGVRELVLRDRDRLQAERALVLEALEEAPGSRLVVRQPRAGLDQLFDAVERAARRLVLLVQLAG